MKAFDDCRPHPSLSRLQADSSSRFILIFVGHVELSRHQYYKQAHASTLLPSNAAIHTTPARHVRRGSMEPRQLRLLLTRNKGNGRPHGSLVKKLDTRPCHRQTLCQWYYHQLVVCALYARFTFAFSLCFLLIHLFLQVSSSPQVRLPRLCID